MAIALVELRRELQNYNDEIQRAQSLLMEAPEPDSLLRHIEQLIGLRNDLEKEWQSEILSLGFGLCSYGILPRTEGPPSIGAVSEILSSFQRSITDVYGGLFAQARDGLKLTSTTGRQTVLRLGHMNPGSMIVHLLVDRQQRSFWERDDAFKETFDTMRHIVKSDSVRSIDDFIGVLGDAPVRSTYKWAYSHVVHKSEIRMSWQSDRAADDSYYLLQMPELARLRQLMMDRSEQDADLSSMRAELIGWDLRRRTFKLDLGPAWVPTKFIRTRYINGRIAPTVDMGRRVSVPAFYDVQVESALLPSKPEGWSRVQHTLRIIRPASAS